MDIKILLGKLATYIINPVIVLGFVIATIFFFYGIVKLIFNADGNQLEENKRNVLYGIIGLFVMFSVYGILRIVIATFDIPCNGLFFC